MNRIKLGTEKTYWGVDKITNIALKRNLHPSVFKKIRKTKELKKEGIDPAEYTAKGGLDLETYNLLSQKRKQETQILENYQQSIIKKYGSIKAASRKVGPCKKINPVIGNKNALVLLTEFKDLKHTVDGDFFQKLLFSKGTTQSMRDYYLEASSNKLDINGTVYDNWYTSRHDMGYYIDKNPVRGDFPLAEELVEETIHQAINSGIDFKPFAKDGKIELLYIIFAGDGMDNALSNKTILPHMNKLNKPIKVQNGIWADRYCLVSEYPLEEIGCFCHETGHLLGLPDFYNNFSIVTGSWCLMSSGGYLNNGKTPAHPSAWCKIHMGWNEPKQIDGVPSTQEIPAIINDDGIIYKLDVAGSGGNEYFLLENRQKKGFDSYLPDSGLLIWHVNENKCITLQPNADPENYFITLVQSDGKNELQADRTCLSEKTSEEYKKNLTGDEGDAYPGINNNRSFDEKSTPKSDSYKGKPSKVSVTSISDSGPVMKADLGAVKSAKSKKTISPEKSESKLLFRFLTSLKYSKLKQTPYDKGYETGKMDQVKKLEKKLGLNYYQEGYMKGFRKAFKKPPK